MSLEIVCKRCKNKLEWTKDWRFLRINIDSYHDDYARYYVCNDCLIEFKKMYNDWLNGEVKE